ncbi:hypothetical protein BGLA2_1700035 [Burkholderia gladioli]|nr:hypothetical protein BGLA2_1700035 [Burkholderia gladioli]
MCSEAKRNRIARMLESANAWCNATRAIARLESGGGLMSKSLHRRIGVSAARDRAPLPAGVKGLSH